MGQISRIEPAGFIGGSPHRGVSRRMTLQDSGVALVEDSYIAPDATPPAGPELRHQIVIPYHGLFAYHVGRKSWLMDANGLLLISPGWDFRDEHPIAGLGHGALLITPSQETLEEICRVGGVGAAFQSMTRSASAEIGLLANLLRKEGLLDDPLQRDELAINLIRQALRCPPSLAGSDGSAVRRAKELLHARSDERMTLSEIAGEVGVSPVYLTQEFTRVEGIPLYRYQLRLRLGRALTQLAECDSITGLALDLGFYSHSHFTSAFRSSFGLTPSKYRASSSSQVIQKLAAA